MSNGTELGKKMFFQAAYAKQSIETRRAISDLPQEMADIGVFYIDFILKYVSQGDYDEARDWIGVFKEALLEKVDDASKELDRTEALRNTLRKFDE